MTTTPPVALLAGGLATRMRPLTEKIPKSLLEVAGEPFIAHQLRLLQRQAVTRVVVCAGYLGEMVEAFVGDGARFGLSVSYSYDGDKLLGTGGALAQALPDLTDEFVVMYGDSWLNTDFAAVVDAFRASGKLGLMTVFQNENAWDKSNVEFEDGVICNYDKRVQTPAMHHIDWGLGVLKAAAFAPWRTSEKFDLADLYSGLVEQGQLAGYEVAERFYEIGSMTGLDETNLFLKG